MPDDSAAILHLRSTVVQLRKVFAKAPGLCWGDALPHHPAQTAGMSAADIELLHARPTRLPADSLTWEESDYFFSHAGYTGNPEKHLKPAIKYFLPRYAEFFSHTIAPMYVGVTTDVRIFGEILGRVSWRNWPHDECGVIADWLHAWGLASAYFRSDLQGDSWPCMWNESPEHRDVPAVLHCLCASGVDLGPLVAAMDGMSIKQTLRVAGDLLSHNRKRMRKGELFRLPEARIGADQLLLDWLKCSRTRTVLEQGVFDSIMPQACSTLLAELEAFAEPLADQ